MKSTPTDRTGRTDRQDNNLEDKLRTLEKRVAELPSFVIAFSGGVDSVFLAAVAQKTSHRKILAITVDSQFVPGGEIESAQKTAYQIGIEHLCVNENILADKEVVKNSPQRCYYCKKRIFSLIRKAAEKRGVRTLLHGVNLDDLGDYRPGLKAADEMGFLSPLADAGLTKKDIRELSRQMGLDTWNKPSQSCLATRIPYHDVITKQKLEKIDAAEKVLHSLGFEQVRVRLHGGTARVEVEPYLIPKLREVILRERISDTFKKIGFENTSIDMDGYKTGKMNDEILTG